MKVSSGGWLVLLTNGCFVFLVNTSEDKREYLRTLVLITVTGMVLYNLLLKRASRLLIEETGIHIRSSLSVYVSLLHQHPGSLSNVRKN